jgi:hypothetical protein
MTHQVLDYLLSMILPGDWHGTAHVLLSGYCGELQAMHSRAEHAFAGKNVKILKSRDE